MIPLANMLLGHTNAVFRTVSYDSIRKLKKANRRPASTRSVYNCGFFHDGDFVASSYRLLSFSSLWNFYNFLFEGF